jgi:hypothetical protein
VRLKAIACSALLMGCSSMPEKPTVEMGDVDFPAGEVITRKSTGSEASVRAPLSTYDKATCFKPREWEKEKAYIKLLEHFANACVTRRPDE